MKTNSSDALTQLSIRIYSPEPLLGSPVLLLKSIAGNLIAGRELAWRLFLRDLSAQYRQTALGYVWVFLPPLLSSLTFIFLSSQGIITIDTGGVPYPAFAMMGTLLWQVFVDSITSPIQSMGRAKAMLAKVNFPREAVIMGGLYTVFFNFLVRLLLVVGVMIVWKITPSSTIMIFPLAMVSLMMGGLCIGLLLTPIAMLYGDVQRALSLLTSFWMLLTPVVYPARTEGLAGYLAVWNPVSPIIVTARECLTGLELSMLGPFAAVTVGALFVLFIGLVAFRVAMPHIIVRLGG